MSRRAYWVSYYAAHAVHLRRYQRHRQQSKVWCAWLLEELRREWAT